MEISQVFKRFERSHKYKEYGIRWLLPEATETLKKVIKISWAINYQFQ